MKITQYIHIPKYGDCKVIARKLVKVSYQETEHFLVQDDKGGYHLVVEINHDKTLITHLDDEV